MSKCLYFISSVNIENIFLDWNKIDKKYCSGYL